MSAEMQERLAKMSPEERAQFEERRGRRGRRDGDGPPNGQQPAPNAEAKPEGEEKPAEGAAPPEGGEAPTTIKRPTEAKDKADPAELKAVPVDGKVEFNFRGQPWPDVLDWYASVSASSLDWQELPADFLNLSTQRPHTIAETRDLLNKALLARGFTMLLHDDMLLVVKIDKVDPSMVPRVEPDDLEEHPPYDFVRTRFPLPATMDPATAKDDVKVLLTPSARVTPLLASRQLQVIDAVTNLRDVRDLLYDEQSAAARDVRPREFVVRHRRADYVAEQVMIVLGLDPSSLKSPMEMQLEQQRMQLYMQMQQQGKDVSKMLKQDGPEVHIAVDKRRNALLVNAAPKEMEMVKRTVEQFDVPETQIAADHGADRKLSLEKYPTNSAEAVVEALTELGTLDPLTQLQYDERADVIFAFATVEDHDTIKRMIEKLDGEGRSGRVIALNRRMSAEQAAGTIQALLVGEQQESEDSGRERYGYYGGWDGGWGGGRDRRRSDGEFRVQADIENNRLLLWANDPEYQEVLALLETLGAVTTVGKNADRLRVLEAGTPEDTARLLERLKDAWGGENELEIRTPPAATEPKPEPTEAEPTDAEPTEAEPAPAAEPKKDRLTLDAAPAPRVWLAQYSDTAAAEPATTAPAAEAPAVETPSADAPVAEAPPAEERSADAPPAGDADKPAPPGDASEAAPSSGVDAAPKSAPPVVVTVTEDGRIILRSDDSGALDQIEELLDQLAPQPKEFEAFFLKNSDAYDVWWNLKDYFEDELKGQTESVFDMWGEYAGSRRSKSGPASLGRRRQLRFIYDSPTNSIVVQNASEAQLQIIRELIRIYDQPVGEDSVARRLTEPVQLQYSSAQQIATALKEVYRDLLSSKDKEFQSRDGQQRTTRTETYYRFGFSGNDASDKKKSPIKVAFEGALSIGVDEISNTLIISAEENIMEDVKRIVHELDQKAKPNSVVQVHKLRGSLKGAQLKTALAAALSQPWPGGKPTQAAAPENRGDRDDERRGDRDRGDRGGDGGNGD
jgi:hypothetical protein